MLSRDAEPAAGPAELVPLAGGAADLHGGGAHPAAQLRPHHRQHRHAQEVTLLQWQFTQCQNVICQIRGLNFL